MDKHIRIYREIENMKNTSRVLKELIDRIEGKDNEVEKNVITDSPSVSFSYFIDDAADIIGKENEYARELVHKLESIIFGNPEEAGTLCGTVCAG